jgi:cysteinyl-tRNA synthetase
LDRFLRTLVGTRRGLAISAALILVGGLVLGLVWRAASAPPPDEYASADESAPDLSGARMTSFPFRNWITYYGRDQVDELSSFDLINLDLEPHLAAYSADEVALLRSRIGPRGGKVLSYLNIGACENTRGYWSHLDERGRQVGCEAFRLAPYRGYPGEFWMDVRKRAYHDLIVNVAASALVERGVDGFVLDNLDNYQAPLRGASMAERKQGIADIIRRLRARYPDKLIVVLNGIYALGSDDESDNVLFWPDRHNADVPVYRYVDLELHEDVNSYPDCPVRGEYCRQDMMAALAELQREGIPVLLLDYASEPSVARLYYRRTICAGFLPYVTSESLDVIRQWDRVPPRPPARGTSRRAGGEVVLSWQPADACAAPDGDGEEYGTTSYRVYRDGSVIGETYLLDGPQQLTVFRDRDAPPGDHEYAVSAISTGLQESTRTVLRDER